MTPLLPRGASGDRTVHARCGVSIELVRYDRAGKWYIEGGGLRRQQMTIRDAAHRARYWLDCTETGEVFFGRPGGKRFDKLVREEPRP